MAIYTESKFGRWISDEDGATISTDAGNRRYNQMLKEVADGVSTQVPYVEPPLTKEIAYLECENLYASALEEVERANKYTEKEVSTFDAKAEVARRVYDGNGNNQDLFFLAKLLGIVNGTRPPTLAEIEEKVNAFTTNEIEAINEMAVKILKFDSDRKWWIGELETLRDEKVAQLTDGDGNQAIVDALAAEYEALKG
jgi:hypothetical protein